MFSFLFVFFLLHFVLFITFCKYNLYFLNLLRTTSWHITEKKTVCHNLFNPLMQFPGWRCRPPCNPAISVTFILLVWLSLSRLISHFRPLTLFEHKTIITSDYMALGPFDNCRYCMGLENSNACKHRSPIWKWKLRLNYPENPESHLIEQPYKQLSHRNWRTRVCMRLSCHASQCPGTKNKLRLWLCCGAPTSLYITEDNCDNFVFLQFSRRKKKFVGLAGSV